MIDALRKRLPTRPGELLPTLLSGVLFFCVLSSYYVLRPVRDEMAVRGGVSNLKWLFTATFVAMLVTTPVFGWVAARVRRNMLVAGSFLFFLSHMLLFRVALRDAAASDWAPAALFVWVSVFNLFAVSLFWSLMTDVFSLEQAERLFGAIAVGGTLGAITGPLLTASLVSHLGVADMLFVSAALLGLAAVVAVAVSRGPGRAPGSPGDRALGGGAWEGLLLVARSPYLMLFCLYLLCHSFGGTVLYFEQTRIVAEAFASGEARTAFFARVDLAVNLLTVLTQLLGLSPLVRRFGLAVALALLPAIALAGFATLAAWPLLPVLVIFGILRRAGEYAIARPAREMVFTVLPRAMKYKAKNFLDTTVFRGSDALSGWLADALRGFGLGGGALALAGIPAALAGLWAGWRIGRAQAVTSVEADAAVRNPPPDGAAQAVPAPSRPGDRGT